MDDIVNPQDAELEEIVLGACLIESKAITLVAGILRPEVFYIEKNREIYAALQSMYRAGQVIDLMTVKEELTRRGKLDFIGGPYALVSITTRVASSAHLEYHARILQQKYIRREAILGFHKLLAQAADETTDIADTLADAHTLLDQLEKECGMSEHLRSMLQLMEDTVELIETRVASNKNGVTGLPTGFNELNRLTCGWQPGDLIIIAARPSDVFRLKSDKVHDYDYPLWLLRCIWHVPPLPPVITLPCTVSKCKGNAWETAGCWRLRRRFLPPTC